MLEKITTEEEIQNGDIIDFRFYPPRKRQGDAEELRIKANVLWREGNQILVEAIYDDQKGPLGMYYAEKAEDTPIRMFGERKYRINKTRLSEYDIWKVNTDDLQGKYQETGLGYDLILKNQKAL